ncbi:MAG: DUF1553 domain-containing protein [Bryobacterales bacterium]|nr:DUF1553 domain-containing protein [Bryobacterales bacterium]
MGLNRTKPVNNHAVRRASILHRASRARIAITTISFHSRRLLPPPLLSPAVGYHGTVLLRPLLALLIPVAWAAGDSPSFNRDIRPLLSDRCFACHGPDSANRKAGLRLDQEQAAKSPNRAGKIAIVPGKPQQSLAFVRIISDNKALRMPPAYAGHDKLAAGDIEKIKLWIEQGAPWEKHWSLLPPQKPATPAGGHPIDTLVRRRLQAMGLQPSPEAARPTLIRRVTLDLTGLPPTPGEVQAFVNDTAPNAYEKVVDRLLASPRYAERMAIRWLEAARYADTNGYQSDGERSMWRWRDWVLNAFRKNMPFDRFTIEQIAGDMLPNATLDQKIASAFHRNHRTNAEGGIVEEEFRTEYVADRVETTSTVWLGLTFGCARCHDHKYDPLSQKEFYQLFAYFNNVPERGLVYNFGNEEPFIQAPTDEHRRVLAGHDAKVREAEQRWEGMQSRLTDEQRRWEAALAKRDALHWEPTQGLVLKLPLEGAAVGKVGRAESFNGKRELATSEDSARFDFKDPFTFSAWIKPESANGTILSKSEDYFEGEGYQWFLKDGKLRLHITRRFTDISLRLETKDAIPLHEWQHVAISYDGYRKGKGVRIYRNGVSMPIDVLFDELTYPFGPKEPFRLGAGAGDRYLFQGLIDEVRAYNRALTPDEINALTSLEPLQALTPGSPKLRLAFLDIGASPEIQTALRQLEEVRTARRKYDESIPTVMVMVEGEPRKTHLLRRGAYDAPGEQVFAAVPASLPGLKPEWPNNRLGLAQWLVDRANPLTARVTVNRYWQMLFGTGLVKTSEDFGSQGEWPIHQDVLDWLAVEFMDSGWDIRHILKTIVMSETYRQNSAVSPELLQRDPDNRMLARGPRLRLSAEMIRDQALFASGLLVERMGGPSVKPYQPAGLWQELSGGRGYVTDKGEGLYRRSLYTYWKRTVAPPSMITFDSPTRESCIVRETRTNTPLQALTLMNDVTYLEAARKLGERMMHEGLAKGFVRVLSRQPSAKEQAILERTLAQFQSRYQADPKAAEKFLAQGEAPRDAKLDVAQLAAHTSVASLLLNLDEAVTKE